MMNEHDGLATSSNNDLMIMLMIITVIPIDCEDSLFPLPFLLRHSCITIATRSPWPYPSPIERFHE